MPVYPTVDMPAQASVPSQTHTSTCLVTAGFLCSLSLGPPKTDDCLVPPTAYLGAHQPPKERHSSILSVNNHNAFGSSLMSPLTPFCLPTTRPWRVRRKPPPEGWKSPLHGKGLAKAPPKCSPHFPGSWVLGKQLSICPQETWVGILALPLSSCMTDKSLPVPVSSSAKQEAPWVLPGLPVALQGGNAKVPSTGPGSHAAH